MKRIHEYHLLNIPNCLCYLRIILIPVFLYVYFTAGSSHDYVLASIILIVSGISDFLDGYIARRYDMITDFGKIIDPVADKLTQFTVALTLAYTYRLMIVLLMIIFIKDAMLFFTSIDLHRKGCKVKGASWWGKVSTAIFDVTAIFLVTVYIPNTLLANVLIIISSALMALSFVLYLKQVYYIYNHKDEFIND